MNLCYLINQYPKVSHSFVRREILALEALGVEVTRVCARNNPQELVDPQDKEELAKTIVLAQGKLLLLARMLFITAVSSPTRFIRTLGRAMRLARSHNGTYAKYLAYLAEACCLRRICSVQQIDHVHAHFGTNSTTIALLCNALGGPGYSFTVHGPEEFDSPQQLSIGEKIKYSRFVAAVSSFGKSQLFRWCAYEDWHKVKEVHCSVDQSFMAPPSPVQDTTRIINIGRICEQKGQLLLLQAVSILKQRGVNVSLTIVGDGPMRDEAERLIKEHGLEDRVAILGYLSGSEIAAQLDEAAILALPSFAEGLPVVIMESLARARPVLSTYIAGIPELLRDGECGWLVPAGSAEAIADCLAESVQIEPAALYQMGLVGRERVQRLHNDETEARKLRDLFVAAMAEGASIQGSGDISSKGQRIAAAEKSTSG